MLDNFYILYILKMKLRKVWDTDKKRQVYILDPLKKPHQLWTDGEDFYVYDKSRWIKINDLTLLEPAEYGANYVKIDNEMIGYYDSDKSTDMFVFESWDQVYYEFKNWSSVLAKGEIEEGETPVYDGATPTKAADAQYTYTFSWWEPEVGPITHRTIYQAQFTSTVNEYDLTIVVNDDTMWSVDVAFVEWQPYGTPISAEGNVLTIGTGDDKIEVTATAESGYVFSGWGTLPTSVSADATITATFEAEASNDAS